LPEIARPKRSTNGGGRAREKVSALIGMRGPEEKNKKAPSITQNPLGVEWGEVSVPFREKSLLERASFGIRGLGWVNLCEFR